MFDPLTAYRRHRYLADYHCSLGRGPGQDVQPDRITNQPTFLIVTLKTRGMVLVWPHASKDPYLNELRSNIHTTNQSAPRYRGCATPLVTHVTSNKHHVRLCYPHEASRCALLRPTKPTRIRTQTSKSSLSFSASQPSRPAA